jgi:type IV secretory pathway VirB4 component
MLNLAEYRQRPALLADWLPWAGLVAPGVVLNKDGSFQRTARFRGPDLDSATQGELIATSARLNNALRRLGSGWALFIEAERRPAADYPHSDFPEPLSWLVDECICRPRNRAPVQRECCTRTDPPKAWTGAVGSMPSSRKPIASLTCSMA